jgi:hypothetical protein
MKDIENRLRIINSINNYFDENKYCESLDSVFDYIKHNCDIYIQINEVFDLIENMIKHDVLQYDELKYYKKLI